MYQINVAYKRRDEYGRAQCIRSSIEVAYLV